VNYSNKLLIEDKLYELQFDLRDLHTIVNTIQYINLPDLAPFSIYEDIDGTLLMKEIV
jgi:hypothetical protein